MGFFSVSSHLFISTRGKKRRIQIVSSLCPSRMDHMQTKKSKYPVSQDHSDWPSPGLIESSCCPMSPSATFTTFKPLQGWELPTALDKPFSEETEFNPSVLLLVCMICSNHILLFFQESRCSSTFLSLCLQL